MSTKIKINLRYIAIAFFLAIFIPLLYIFRKNNRFFRSIMCRSIIFFSGIKIKLEGEFDETAKLLILNHQSMLDIISVESVHTLDLCWVSKKEITDYFYYGHINKAPKMISVDREDKTGLMKLLADAKDRLSTGRPLAIFPEGTRGKEQTMLPFKAGAKMVAEKLGLKVQPVVVVDSAKFLTVNHFSLKNSPVDDNILEIVILPSFIPEKGSNWFEDTRESMQAILESRRCAE